MTNLTIPLLLNLFTNPALAGHYVLNQTPQTIERYFGCHIIKKTHGGQVTYTYKPQSFRRVFPQFPKSNFSITLAALSTLHVQGTILHIMVP